LKGGERDGEVVAKTLINGMQQWGGESAQKKRRVKTLSTPRGEHDMDHHSG